MADPYTPFGYAMPAIPGFNPRLPGYRAPNTMTGQEMGPPPAVAQPSWGDSAQSFALGVLNPFGFTPPPPVQQPGTVPTLTGDMLPLPQSGADWRPADPTGAAVGGMFGMGPAFRVAGRVAASEPVQAAGRIVANPTVAGPAALAGSTYLNTTRDAEAENPATVDQDLTDAKAAQKSAQKALDDLRAEERTFTGLGSLPSGTPAEKAARDKAIRDAQTRLRSERLYDGGIDGNWGGRTTTGVQQFLDRNRAAQAKAEKALETVGGRLTTLERDRAEKAAEESLPTWRRLQRDYAGPAGLVAGIAAPAWLRRRMLSRTNAADATAAGEANALINPGAPLADRVSSTNSFFRRGGGREPFDVAPNAPLGFAPAAVQQSADDLFQPGRFAANVRSGDVGRTAGFAATGAASYASEPYFRDRVEQAKKEFKASPTEANARRQAVEESMHAASLAGFQFGRAAAVGYPAITSATRYQAPRPNVAAARTEVMNLNERLRNQLPPIAERRAAPGPYTGGHWVQPGPAGQPWTPAIQGEAVEMMSAGGRKRLIQQPDGSWLDPNNKPGTPRANWRRVSSAAPLGFAPPDLG